MPRAVQRATAADVPYSMSSGCATTQSTRWKDSSGRAGNVMSAILPCQGPPSTVLDLPTSLSPTVSEPGGEPGQGEQRSRLKVQQAELIDADRPPISGGRS